MTAQPNSFASHWLIRDSIVATHVAAAGPNNVLFVGDSIVEGFYWNRIGGLSVINAGYSGIWTEALEPKIEHLAHAAKPKIAALLVGTNDAKMAPESDYLAGIARSYEKIVRVFRTAKIPLIAFTPPPVEQGKRLTDFFFAETMRNVAEQIRRIAETHGAMVVDLHATFGLTENATSDGIHLASPAYRLMRDLFAEKLAVIEAEAETQ